MIIKLNKLHNRANHTTYYLNISCKKNNNSISEITINYNSSFNHFVENTVQNTYFIADKVECSEETIINLLKRNIFSPSLV